MTNNDITPLPDDTQVHLFWQGPDLFHPGHGSSMTAAEARIECRRLLSQPRGKIRHIKVTNLSDPKHPIVWNPRTGWQLHTNG